MAFERNIDGMEIMLEVNGYVPSTSPKHCHQGDWCDCSFRFRFKDIIDYHREHDEVLLSEDVDYLIWKLTDLLDGKITGGPSEEWMTEPDFVFVLHPQTDLRSNPNEVYVAPGNEIRDIYVEWQVYLWQEGAATCNCISITLCREDVEALRDYLECCRQSEN